MQSTPKPCGIVNRLASGFGYRALPLGDDWPGPAFSYRAAIGTKGLKEAWLAKMGAEWGRDLKHVRIWLVERSVSSPPPIFPGLSGTYRDIVGQPFWQPTNRPTI